MSMYDWNQDKTKAYNEKYGRSSKQSTTSTPDTEIDAYAGLGPNSEATSQETVETNETVPYMQQDQFMFRDQAKEMTEDIYNPMLEGVENEIGMVDKASDISIKGLESQIPYLTRQFESFAAKSGLGTGMQGKMINELMTNIGVEASNIYSQAELQKAGLRSEMYEIQSAMERGEVQLAQDLYTQAVSQAQFASDYLGVPFVQPEVAFVYDQMLAASSIVDDPNASQDEKDKAQQTYNDLASQLRKSGFSGDIGEGVETYAQAQQRIAEEYNVIQQQIANETFDYQVSSQLDTVNAMRLIATKDVSIEQALEEFPFADVGEIIEYYQELNKDDGGFSEADLLSLQEFFGTSPQE